MDGQHPAFRKWSIVAFAAESMAVILAFLFMVFILKWKIDTTMMYILFIFMVFSAVLLLVTGKTAAGR
jgi:hypothetical protein